ncbi:MAG: DUF72 domain-containing protein [Nitrospira sp.]|nr:DUF72 domain-containing protein [Nitrospira sp.]MCP9442730.1 DUF72 domain-containing protein [Nitrospira sp.]
MARLFVGTSGWTYSSWKGTFYPDDLPSRQFLPFYARVFDTTEVNYSFYHLPRPSTYQTWAAQVPDEFVFALKASRFLTHVKRLVDVEEAWATFVRNGLALGPHLGPILLQFPPSLRCDQKLLAKFLKIAQRPAPTSHPLRLAFEFRHESWFTEAISALLREHHAALCIADSPRYPRRDEATAEFVYIRFHGRTELFASKYTDQELAEEAGRIRRYMRDGLDVYAYFNNDASGHAVANAMTLGRLLRGTESS